jgi:hypothetical protein
MATSTVVTSDPAATPPAKESFSASKLLGELVNSAFVLAVAAAVCYWTGYLIQTQDAERLRLPRDLLPESPKESLIVLGAALLVVLLGLSLSLYAIGALVLGRLPASWREATQKRYEATVRAHPTFYLAFGVFVVLALVGIVAVRVPLAWSWRYEDDNLPAVVNLQLKGAKVNPEGSQLRLLSRRNGWVVLKYHGAKRYLVVREDEVLCLGLNPEPNTGRHWPGILQ